MKVLLTAINAKYIHSNLAVFSLRAAASKAPLIGEDVRVDIAEFTINNYIDDIFSKLYRAKPDVLVFSCYIWNISMVEELADLMHKAIPGLPIWVGGPEVSFDALDVLGRNAGICGVMCGEGEATFSELIQFISREGPRPSDESLGRIDGLVYRAKDGSLCTTGAREALDMDTLPFPYEDLDSFKNRIIYYESSRGCPFSCSYCLSSIDKHVRFRSLDLVKKELKAFIDHGIPQIKFVDRTFNCRHARTLELWRFIRDNDRGITNFHFEITADLLNEEEMDLLASLRPGLVQLEIGVQTTNPRTIAEIDRVMDFEQLKGIVERIKAGGNVHQHLDLIAGLPYEGMDSFKKSFNDVFALWPQQLQMGFLKVLKGSKMHRVGERYGLVYRTRPPYEVMSTRWLHFDEVLALKGVEEMVEVYYNSTQFMNSLRYMLHFFRAPYDLFEALAGFYENEGLFDSKHSRLDRYTILRNFAQRSLEAKQAFDPETMDAVLIYDLYLRENLKSRPAWARDLSVHNAAVAAFYSDGAMREKYFKDYEGASYRQLRNETHVEIFSRDVAAAASRGESCSGFYPVLFDYGQRDKLTYEGKATPLTGDLELPVRM